jgi:hypothetical protein
MQLNLDAVKTLESLHHRLVHLELKLGVHGMNPDTGSANDDSSRNPDSFSKREIKRWTVKFDTGMDRFAKKRAYDAGVWLMLPLILMGEKRNSEAAVQYHLKWNDLVTPKFYRLNSDLDMSAQELSLLIREGNAVNSTDIFYSIVFFNGDTIGFSNHH